MDFRELDEQSTPSLVELALTQNPEDDSYWDTVWALRKRATDDVFVTAVNLCKSDDLSKRTLGVNILAQLAQLGMMGTDTPPYKEEALGILLPMLDDPQNREIELLDSIIVALGHQHDLRTAEPVARFKGHEEADIRRGVAISLGGLECETAIAALIELSRDENPRVRDWATFGFGAQMETDTPSIRTALAQRLDDPDYETRNEAIRGLAQRKDEHVIEALIRELAMENPHGLAIEAACNLGDPRLLPGLLRIKEAGLLYKTLDEAIERCRSANP